MRTVGKIVLENGQKVYKRFGAATKDKIKLGQAAFTDIANNLTTTEEGSVLDARQGKQLYEQIQSVNSIAQNANGSLLKMTMVEKQFKNETDSKNYFDNFSASFSNNTYYRFAAGNYYTSTDPLSGYVWYVEGYKMMSGYEWQHARTYRPDLNGTMYYRTKYANKWGAWMKIL